MSKPVTVVLTDEQRAVVLDGIRVHGMSLTGAARLVGRSREWLKVARRLNPDFGEEVQKALGELERDMSRAVQEALAGDDGALLNARIKARSNRFPQLHGEDPRLRYSIETAGEEHDEDAPGAKVQDEGIPPEVRDALLTAYYAERDAPKPTEGE
jgi:hypothetical protein